MTEYNILLTAKINADATKGSIQNSINSIQKSIVLNISNVKIDPTALANIKKQVSDALSGISGGTSGAGGSGGTSRGGGGTSSKYTMSAAELARVNTAVGNLNTKLQTLKATNVDAFKVPGIEDQYNHMLDLSNALAKGKTGLANVNFEQKKFESNLNKANEGLRTTTKSTDNFVTSIGKAVGKIALWGVATGLLYGSMKKIQEGIQYIKDLNEEMTNIGLVTNQTTEQLSGTAIDFNNKAKELGVTTLDIAQGYVEWARQGRNAADSMTLLTNSTKLAALGDLDAADATTKLTAAINAYGISVKDSINIVDVLVN